MSFREKVYPKVETFQLKPAIRSHTQDMSINTIPDLPPRGPPPTFVQQHQPIFLSSFERMPTPQLNVNVDAHRREGVVYSGINHQFTAPAGGYFHWASLTFCTRTCNGRMCLCQGNKQRKSERPHWRGEGNSRDLWSDRSRLQFPQIKKKKKTPVHQDAAASFFSQANISFRQRWSPLAFLQFRKASQFNLCTY